jgi:hypothetical protein
VNVEEGTLVGVGRYALDRAVVEGLERVRVIKAGRDGDGRLHVTIETTDELPSQRPIE